MTAVKVKKGRGDGDLIPSIELKLTAKCDFAKYDCSTSDISFKPTLMFQKRNFTFPLKNTGSLLLQYNWQLDYSMKITCPFQVLPQTGAIEPGKEHSINVNFLPLGATDYAAVLYCNIVNLQERAAPLRISVSGTSIRPLCHIELDPNDYITSIHCSPELKGPGGKLGPLNPDTCVIKVTSWNQS